MTLFKDEITGIIKSTKYDTETKLYYLRILNRKLSELIDKSVCPLCASNVDKEETLREKIEVESYIGKYDKEIRKTREKEIEEKRKNVKLEKETVIAYMKEYGYKLKDAIKKGILPDIKDKNEQEVWNKAMKKYLREKGKDEDEYEELFFEVD